jgi:hypothetical protein
MRQRGQRTEMACGSGGRGPGGSSCEPSSQKSSCGQGGRRRSPSHTCRQSAGSCLGTQCCAWGTSAFVRGGAGSRKQAIDANSCKSPVQAPAYACAAALTRSRPPCIQPSCCTPCCRPCRRTGKCWTRSKPVAPDGMIVPRGKQADMIVPYKGESTQVGQTGCTPSSQGNCRQWKSQLLPSKPQGAHLALPILGQVKRLVAV